MKQQENAICVNFITMLYVHLFKTGAGEKRLFPARILKLHHLSGRSQEKIVQCKPLSAMQSFVAMRILIQSSSNNFDKIEQWASCYDEIEKDYEAQFKDYGTNPFSNGMQAAVHEMFGEVNTVHNASVPDAQHEFREVYGGK